MKPSLGKDLAERAVVPPRRTTTVAETPQRDRNALVLRCDIVAPCPLYGW